jgi:hypothetical protein
MNDELEKDLEVSSRGLIEILFRYLTGGNKETTTNLSDVSQYRSWDSNQIPPENESIALPLCTPAR